MTDREQLERARWFVYANGRLVDRRRFGALFDGLDADGVLAAVLAHRNADGGFAHGLEPDTRTPHSQTLDSWIALETLDSVGVRPLDIATTTCDWLGSVASPDGGLPTLLPTIVGYPRAAHWQETDEYEASLLPTADVTAVLHRWGVEHPFVDQATEWCFAHLEEQAPAGAHEIRSALTFLAEVPDQERAAPLVDGLDAALPASSYYQADPDDPEYGVAPWSFAPTPDSRWRSLFDDDLFEAHLDRLERDQQADGGWTVAWEPAEGVSGTDARGLVTLEALRVLSAYGRLQRD